YSGCHHIPALLSRLGLLRSADTGGRRPGLATRLRGLIPLPVRQVITRCLPKRYPHGLATRWMNQGTDWAGTRPYMIPHSNEAYLRLTLAGREPEGIVSPEDGEPLLRKMREDLGQLQNPDNGEPAAERVTLVEDVFRGAERPHLPDLVVSWRSEAR